jgi:alkylated DNA nucleotide flippase Atl1
MIFKRKIDMEKIKRAHPDELNDFLGAEDSWRRVARDAMERIPAGHLASYGRIASLVWKKTGRNPGARSIAWLRRELYRILTHDNGFLHRIAKAGDVNSMADSSETKAINDEKRQKEGSLSNPKWL